MKNCIFDFDGTLVDISTRYSKIFHHYLRDRGFQITECSVMRYMQCKRELKLDHLVAEQLYEVKKFDVEEFVKFKKKHIESSEYLKHDSLIGDFRTTINIIKNLDYRIVLATLRYDESQLLFQLEELGIREAFDEIICVNANLHKEKYFKLKALTNLARSIIISDGINDIRDGKELGMKTYFVKTGLSRDIDVNLYNPIIMQDYTELKQILA